MNTGLYPLYKFSSKDRSAYGSKSSVNIRCLYRAALAATAVLACMILQSVEASAQTSGPQQTKIYFTREGSSNHMLVNAQINNRPVTMIFDTGASVCVIGKNQLAELGIKTPEGTARGTAHGIGAMEGVPIWVMQANIRVGDLVNLNCPIAVQDELSMHPLLGQTFFGNYTYSIDEGAMTITLRRKGVNTALASAPSSRYVVPFRHEGRNIVVTAVVNGHSYPMYVDTGAQTNVISQGDLQKLGLTTPDYAPVVRIGGIAGITTGRSMTINRLQLGPVDRADVQVIVLDQSAIGRPLLGQPYFEGWEMQVDNVNSQILFTRR